VRDQTPQTQISDHFFTASFDGRGRPSLHQLAKQPTNARIVYDCGSLERLASSLVDCRERQKSVETEPQQLRNEEKET
jgi:hypothetical protein